MFHVVAVFLLTSFIGGRSYVQSTHLTAEACQEELALSMGSGRGGPVAACIPGMYRIEISPLSSDTDKAVAGTRRTSIDAKGQTCTGDDRFCGRL